MNVYTCIDHRGHNPVGVSSLIVAENEDEARRLLIAELAEHGLKQEGKPFTLRLMNISSPRAYVLQDGDY
jgi:hypothetical protein